MQFEESWAEVLSPDFDLLVTATSATLLVPTTLALTQWEYSHSGVAGDARLVFVDFLGAHGESVTEVIGYPGIQRESAIVDLLMRATDSPLESPPRQGSEVEEWLSSHLERRERMRASLVTIGTIVVVVDGEPVEAVEFRAQLAGRRVLCFDGERGSAVALSFDREPPVFTRYAPGPNPSPS